MKVQTKPTIVRVSAKSNAEETDANNKVEESTDTVVESKHTTNAVPTKADTEEKILSESMQGLGFMISWGYAGNFHVKPDDIQTIFEAAGIDDMTVPDVTITHAVRNAVGNFRKRQIGDNLYKAEVLGKSKEEGVKICIQRNDSEEDKRSNWLTCHIVHLSADNKTWLDTDSDEAEIKEACDKLRQTVEYRRDHYTGVEFTRNILKPAMKSLRCLKLQDVDGLYYVVEGKKEDVRKLKTACSQLNGMRFRARSLQATADNQADFSDDAKSSLSDRIEKLKDSVAEWKAKSKIRKNSEDALFGELDTIKEDAEMLSMALGFNLDDINTVLDDLRASAREMLDIQEANETERKMKAQEGSLNRWRNVMTEEFLVDEGLYIVPVECAELVGIKKTTLKNFYFKKGQVHARSLGELGYFGYIQDSEIVINSLDA